MQQQIITQYIQIPLEEWESLNSKIDSLTQILKDRTFPRTESEIKHMNIADFAKEIDLSPRTIRRWKKEGSLEASCKSKGFRILSHQMIKQEYIIEFINENK